MEAGPERVVGGSGVHYDIPPEVFELLLDRNLNYSSGIYPRGDEDLDTAQIEKMDAIASTLSLRPGSRVLDVGCGWAGPACYLARRHGCEITGITLSETQRAHGLDRARALGVADRVRIDVRDVLEMDYPECSFDAIIFLESIIHMPAKPAIFDRCHALLEPGGRVFIQESNYDRGSRTERYRAERGFELVNEAFGGTGTMVSAGGMFALLEESGLVPAHLEDISHHYPRTLSQWLDNLDFNKTRMREVSEQAYRMLRRYLMMALHTYRRGGTVCHQMSARRPR